MVSGKSFQSLSAITEKTLSPEEIVLVLEQTADLNCLKDGDQAKILKHYEAPSSSLVSHTLLLLESQCPWER